MYAKPLSLTDNQFKQRTNVTSVIHKWAKFLPILSLLILFAVLPTNFIVSGVKISI